MSYDLFLRNKSGAMQGMRDFARVMCVHSASQSDGWGERKAIPLSVDRQLTAISPGGGISGSYSVPGIVNSKSTAELGILGSDVWHATYTLHNNPWSLPDFGSLAGVHGTASIYVPEQWRFYASGTDPFFPYSHMIAGEIYGEGFTPAPPVGAIGLKIDNLYLRGDRRIMRLIASGHTTNRGGRIQSFYFSCSHLDFCVYFLPVEPNIPTAQHVIRNVGDGVYEAFFIGAQCRVAVYERKSGLSPGQYGIRFYNDSGNVAIDDGDTAMIPERDIFVPSLGNGGWVDLMQFDANRLINMHCNRFAGAVSMWEKSFFIYRDWVEWNSQYNVLQYKFGVVSTLRQSDMSNTARTFYFDFKGNSANFTMNTRVTSVGVVNTSNVIF